MKLKGSVNPSHYPYFWRSRRPIHIAGARADTVHTSGARADKTLFVCGQAIDKLYYDSNAL